MCLAMAGAASRLAPRMAWAGCAACGLKLHAQFQHAITSATVFMCCVAQGLPPKLPAWPQSLVDRACSGKGGSSSSSGEAGSGALRCMLPGPAEWEALLREVSERGAAVPEVHWLKPGEALLWLGSRSEVPEGLRPEC